MKSRHLATLRIRDGDGGTNNAQSVQSVLLFKDSSMVDRIFHVFDANEDDLIILRIYNALLHRRH